MVYMKEVQMPAKKQTIRVKISPRDRRFFKDLRAIPQVESSVKPFTSKDVVASLTRFARTNRAMLDKAGIKIPVKLQKQSAHVRSEGSSKTLKERQELEGSFKGRLRKSDK